MAAAVGEAGVGVGVAAVDSGVARGRGVAMVLAGDGVMGLIPRSPNQASELTSEPSLGLSRPPES